MGAVSNLASMFGMGSVAAKKFLFVSQTGRPDRPYFDPSVRYRCYAPAEVLLRQGHFAQVVSQKVFEENISKLDGYDAYVFHRPSLSERLAEFMLENTAKVPIIGDVDDLMFDVRFAGDTPAVKVRGQSEKQVRAYLAKSHDGLSMCNGYTASTVPLCERLAAFFPGKPVRHIPNVPDAGFIEVCDLVRTQNPVQSRPYTFGYFSGTATHDRDLRMIAPALAAALQGTDRRLLLVGPIAVPAELSELSAQIDRQPLVPFHELPGLMARCQAVLAPLEASAFADCKSGLKYFEAALCGSMVLATPIPDIDRFNSLLLRKCTTPQEWMAALCEPYPANALAVQVAVSELREQMNGGQNAQALMALLGEVK